MTDYTLPADINYQKNLYKQLNIGNDASLQNSLSQNRLATDINAYLDNNPTAKSILGSGIKINQPQTAPMQTVGVNQLPTDSTGNIDTSITAINQFQNPEAKYSGLGDTLNTYLKNNQSLRDEILSGIGTMKTTLSSIEAPKQSYMDMYKGLRDQYGVSADMTRLNELTRASEGIKSDLSSEIARAGGVANESQLASLSAERSYPIIKEYNALKDALEVKTSMIDKLMTYAGMDRQEAEKQIELKTNLNEKIISSYANLSNQDANSVNMLMNYEKNNRDLAQKKLELLLNSGGLSTLPDSSLAKLANDTGIDIAMLRNASKSVDSQLALEKALKNAQLSKAYADIRKDQPVASTSVAPLINNINTIVSNPQLENAVGVKGLVSFINPEAYQLKQEIDQVKNMLTLENRSKLKGQGTITDSETKMLEKSATALSTLTSPQKAKEELIKIRGTVQLMNNIPTRVILTDKEGNTGVREFSNFNMFDSAVKSGLTVTFE